MFFSIFDERLAKSLDDDRFENADVGAWLVELARDAGLDERDIEIAERGCLLDESPADIAGDLGFAEKAVRNGITEIEKTLHTELQT